VRNLLNALERPDLIELCDRGPGPHQQPVVEFLQQVFATRSQAEWVEWFEGRDICFAPVKNLREAFDDPQVEARGMRLVDELGQEHIGIPIRFRHEPGEAEFALPELGQHTRDVLQEFGYSPAEIEAMRAVGACHEP
jgi:crotonobetainyl-CoA:carnitine CoA-transferase CaiB-like acyl-CoA transferase